MWYLPWSEGWINGQLLIVDGGNQRRGVCTCRCSDAQVSTMYPTPQWRIMYLTPQWRGVFIKPPVRGQRLPYWAVLSTPSSDNCQVSVWMQEKSLQVLSLVERFHDARIVDKLKATCILLFRSTWETWLAEWLSRRMLLGEHVLCRGASPSWLVPDSPGRRRAKSY
jgi:glycyl-tRNA synthetase alpha subunit